MLRLQIWIASRVRYFVVASLLDVKASILLGRIISWRNIIHSGVYLADLSVVWKARVDLVASLIGHGGELVPVLGQLLLV